MDNVCGYEAALARLPDAAFFQAQRKKYFRERKMRTVGPNEVLNIGLVINLTGRAADAALPAYTDDSINNFVRSLNSYYGVTNPNVINHTPVSFRPTAQAEDFGVNFYIERIQRRFILRDDECHAIFFAADYSLPREQWTPGLLCVSQMHGLNSMTDTDSPLQMDAGGISHYRRDLFCNIWVGRFTKYAQEGNIVGRYSDYQDVEIGANGFAWQPRGVGPSGNDFPFFTGCNMQEYVMGSRWQPYDWTQMGDTNDPDEIAAMAAAGYGDGAVCAHELGHYLNLDHTWGSPESEFPTFENTICGSADATDLPINDGAFRNSRTTVLPDNIVGEDITRPRVQAVGHRWHSEECFDENGVATTVPYSNYMNYANPNWMECFSHSQVSIMRSACKDPVFTTHQFIGTSNPPLNCNNNTAGINILDMSAVGSSRAYFGDNLIWEKTAVPPPNPDPLEPDPIPDPVVPESTLSSTYFGEPVTSGSFDVYYLYFSGMHTIQDPNLTYSIQARLTGGGWHVANIGALDGVTWTPAPPPGVPFDIESRIGVEVQPGKPNTNPPFPGRIRYKLSDGTITEWIYSSSRKKKEI